MKMAEYTWGEYNKDVEITKKEMKEMRRLTPQEISGFSFRSVDIGKTFYASEDYVDAGVDGVAVKFSYVKSD
jgi:hypothetical protein